MLQKQLENVLAMLKVSCHYFFNWDEFIINQVGLSCLLVLLLCRSWILAVVCGFVNVAAAMKQMKQRVSEQLHDEQLFDSITMFRHRA